MLTPKFSILVGIGVEMTFEVIAAAALLRRTVPALRVRVVNVTDLMILGPAGSHPHALTDADFDALFTKDRPVHINFHGYPVELKGLVFGRTGLERVTIEGYREEGTTTSPFDVGPLFSTLCTHEPDALGSDDVVQPHVPIPYRGVCDSQRRAAEPQGGGGLACKNCARIASCAERPRLHLRAWRRYVFLSKM